MHSKYFGGYGRSTHLNYCNGLIEFHFSLPEGFFKMGRSKSQFRLMVESLESRRLMAGDVSVALEGSFLRVEGDNLDNQIAISQTVAGDVVVAGQNGTLINGLASVRFVRPALNAMEVRMEGGNDTVTLRGVQVANDMFVDLGAGNDRVTSPLNSPVLIGANANIYGSEGNDIVQLAGAVVREDLYVDGGLGTLNANLLSMTVDKMLSIVGDEANDIVAVSSSIVGMGVSIETKGGSDRVTLTNLDAFSLMVNTDSNAAIGADQVTMNQIRLIEDLGIFTGAGNDIVRLTDVSSGKASVSLDEGNDRLIATNVSAVTDVIFEGGAGFDILENLGISAGIWREFKEFESIR